MSDVIRVLIADDQELLRGTFRLLVDSDPGMMVVAEAADGEEASALCAEHRPDVVLMDVQMPRMSGLEATRALCSQVDGPKVIVLTMFDLDEYIYEALRAGASGFLLKNSPPAELLRAIKVVHEGNALLAPEITKRLIATLAPSSNVSAMSTGAPCSDTRLERLTVRERETFALIARGRSNDEIAAELHLSRMTVRTYVSRILTKLDSRDRASLVVIAYETGFITPENQASQR
ncbi:DNA-binding response regulator [Arthrobacter sp. MYb227]|uniref:response regulator transcription factor n=1 Tax=Arthrobacter sp. MYb227 TaxID=1848601 RepID=UPI000CFE2A24|nr:response regulator transcription factor [Arthrobacter sp. MYb227]PQZ93731.1 DNA-binding response regulator [Arthrobacter sp. MYb227]